MNKTTIAASLYNSLYFAEKRANRLEEKLHKVIEQMTPEESAQYVKETLRMDNQRKKKKE